MKVAIWWSFGLVLLAGCQSQVAPVGPASPISKSTVVQGVGPPFSKAFLTSDSSSAAGTNLYLVLDNRPHGGVDALDNLVVQHAAAAIQEARRVDRPLQKVNFIVKKSPTSQFGLVAGFTLSELQQISADPKKGKKLVSLQSWPSVKLPAEQRSAEPADQR